MACSEANRWELLKHTEDTNKYTDNLAYIAHRKHAYILSTNKRDRERGRRVRRFFSFFFLQYKSNAPKINKYSQSTKHQRTGNTTGYRQEGKNGTTIKHLLNTNKHSERQMQRERERNIRHIHSSHNKGISFVFLKWHICQAVFIIPVVGWVAQTHGFQLKSNSERINSYLAWI